MYKVVWTALLATESSLVWRKRIVNVEKQMSHAITTDFFFFRGENRMHLRTPCGTQPKQYPLNSELPCFLAGQWPRNRVSFKLQGLVYRRNTRNALSPEYGHSGASPLVRYRGSTAVSLSRTPRNFPPRRTSSNICCDLAPGSWPPYGRSRDSCSTESTPFSCGPYRKPTRS